MNLKLEEIKIDSIKGSTLNPRLEFPKIHISSLANSMKSVGLLEPILVRPVDHESFEIVHGECRYEAAKLLEWSSIPAQIKKLTDDEVMKIRLHENVFRKDLSPFEKGGYSHRAILSLMQKDKLSQEEFERPEVRAKYSRTLAGEWGVSASTIMNWLELHLKVPEAYRSWVKSGRGRMATRTGLISPYKARYLIRIGAQLKSPKLRSHIFDMNAKESLNKFQMRGLMEYVKKNPYATKEELEKKRETLKEEVSLFTAIPIEIHRKLVVLSEKENIPIETITRNILVNHFSKTAT